MNDPQNLAGAAPRDQRLWNSYVYWARASFGAPPAQLIIADPNARISIEHAALLHALLFATFALEYRLRSVYELLGLSVRKKDGLWNLLENPDRRTQGLVRRRKRVVFPQEWQSVRARLQRLLELRNRIAHGQRDPVALLLGETNPTLRERAVDGYNAVIDAIRIINVAIGYEKKRGAALRNYYAQLQVQ
jgi:hypothetical protein